MSLEKALQENTEAINKLTALFSRYIPASAAVTETEKPAKAPKAEKPAAPVETDNGTGATTIPFPVVEKPAAPAAPVAEEKPAAPAAPAVTLADLQAEGRRLLDAGKQADLKAIITKLGAAKLSTLDASKHVEALALLKAIA